MNSLRFRHFALLMAAVLVGLQSAAAQQTVLTEDFSGSTNIFGVSATQLSVGSSAVYDTGLSGFGPVLAVCKSSAEGIVSGADGQPVSVGDGTVTVEFDAFHGYFGNARQSTVSLLNSDGQVLASYTYSCQNCQVTAATIGGQPVAGFESFALQSSNGSSGANGFGGNGKPYAATGNPHVAITLTARGGVTMTFSKNGAEVKKLLGATGQLKKDVAKILVESTVDNTDRCYALDNIKVSTAELTVDPDYVEPIASVTIVGDGRMTFGPNPDTPFENAYSLTIAGADGTLITEDNLSAKVTDFSVVWDVEGFRTVNDTEGQYCDSYGSFSVNGQGRVATTFDLRDVPMNFYGKLTATVTYNGTTTTAHKYVVALGDPAVTTAQVLPLGGYPADFSVYPDALLGYQVIGETYGAADDLILGGWCVAGSDGGKSAVLSADADGRKFVRFTASASGKSHVMTQTIDSPTGQLIFRSRLRFNSAGAVVTLTGGYPFWSSSRYTCPVTLNFTGTNITLNGTALTAAEQPATFTTGTWYDVVLSADKSSERCYAQVFDAEGHLLAESGVLPWAETSSPTYLSVGMGNSSTGSVDMAVCDAFLPMADANTYTLTADKTTLSIPQGEFARLTASVSDANGYPITQLATWGILEDDMQSSIMVTPDDADSHKATVSLLSTAEAGTATVQVSIGGMAKTLALSLTSSAESIKFTQSTTSITIPMDASEVVTATFAAQLIHPDGNPTGSAVTLAAFDKDGMQPYTFPSGITFDAATGLLSVTSVATPAQFIIRATGRNSAGEELSKSVRVNVHGMKFDFGATDDAALAEGFTAVGPATAYSAVSGYGLVSGTPVVGGTPSANNATSDYLEGAMEFDVKVQKGCFYTVEITYQGVLTTGYVNTDLAGYELGSSDVMTTQTYTLPATLDVLDLRIAANDATSVARIAQVTITKQAKRQKRGKRVVHHVGDSTSANNGSWAYRLKNIIGSEYPELAALCDFHNDGAGGRNLSTYYTQGKLASVLRDIYPGDVLMFGNNGTNGMGSSFEADVNYYLDAAETLGAQIIINSYTPHGAVSNYAGGYNSSTHTFDSYRRDSYETVVRRVASERENTDDNYLGFVEIGKNADAIFNAYVADYAANGYASADAAAQAIISCFTDHNHYSNGTLACDLMLQGYSSAAAGIVSQLTTILQNASTGIGAVSVPSAASSSAIYTLSGQRVEHPRPGALYIVNGKKQVFRK